MSVAALLTGGIGPGGSILYTLTGGLDLGQRARLIGTPGYGALPDYAPYGALAPRAVYGASLEYDPPGILASAVNMPTIGSFPAIDAAHQVVNLWIDWGNALPTGVHLLGPPSAIVTLVDGADPDPGGRIGTPVLGTVPTADGGSGAADEAVIARFGACPGNARYLVWLYCPCDDGVTVVSGYGYITSNVPG